MELPPKTLLNSGHRLCGMELEHTKCLLGLSHHFTAMPTVALLVVINEVTSFLPNATEKFLKFSFHSKAVRSFAFTLHILHEK
jgi:hypothetical protein